MEKTDQELIYDYLEGDENAFKELLKRHLKHVYNFIYILTGNIEESKDITQDTFIKVWKNLKKYNDKYSLNTWVIKIARNTTIDYFRKNKPLLFSDINKEDEIESFEEKLVDTEPLADKLFEKEENRIAVEIALSQISIQKRTIVLMHINEHMTFEEISNILEKPINTIKSQYRRTLADIRNLLVNAPK